MSDFDKTNKQTPHSPCHLHDFFSHSLVKSKVIWHYIMIKSHTKSICWSVSWTNLLYLLFLCKSIVLVFEASSQALISGTSRCDHSLFCAFLSLSSLSTVSLIMLCSFCLHLYDPQICSYPLTVFVATRSRSIKTCMTLSNACATISFEISQIHKQREVRRADYRSPQRKRRVICWADGSLQMPPAVFG